MADLFDQYEQHAGQRSRGPDGNNPRATAAQSSSASDRRGDSAPGKREEEVVPPIFSRQRINFDPMAPISHMCISNNLLIMGLKNNQLTRIDIDNQALTDEIEVSKSAEDCIFNMFLDPSGRHLLVSMKSGDNFYLARGSKKVRNIGKLKGHKVLAISHANIYQCIIIYIAYRRIHVSHGLYA